MPVKRGMYRGEREVKTRGSKTTGIVLMIAFVLIASAWFVFQSGFFDVVEVQVEGIRTLERGDVDREVGEALAVQSRWRPWHPENVLFIDELALKARLKERLFAENVTVDKSFPNILRLKVEERQRSVVLVSNEQYVLVDTTGVVTGYAEDEVLSSAMDRIAARAFLTDVSLPVIQMPTADPLAPGYQIADADVVRKWIEISRILISRGHDTHFMKIEAPGANLARFVMIRRYELRLDLAKPVEEQIETYEAYLRTEGEDGITEYIDVRVPGKAFVK